MQNPDISERNTFTHEMEIDLHMLSPLVLNRVGGEVDRGDVVAIDYCSTLQRLSKLLHELTQPAGLSDGVSNSAIFCFRA
jgi:hypothetical protein